MKLKAVRGMQDILPAQKQMYRIIEDTVRDVLSAYAYQEIGLPQIEQTNLFKRLVGENTDIVEKEMYTFNDRNDESLTLRPEGTAGCVRYAEENGLLFNQVQRFWYSGAMFRYERPQKGRYRQFDQIGAECFGMEGPDIDAELLMMNQRMWHRLGLAAEIRLELNTMGTAPERDVYRGKLVEYLLEFESELDEDSQRRLLTNPLRILDSKSDKTQQILKDAPRLSDCLGAESKAHFEALCRILDDNGIDYSVNPGIVRGLDYYNGTVFEWITSSLGAQGTVCGGGRYDGLAEQIGGRATPGVGFAMGIDRLALMLAQHREPSGQTDIYVVSQGEEPRREALKLAEKLRDALPGRAVLVHCGSGKFKAQLKKADASGAELAIILGEDELANGTVGVKSLRQRGEQEQVGQEELALWCQGFFSA